MVNQQKTSGLSISELTNRWAFISPLLVLLLLLPLAAWLMSAQVHQVIKQEVVRDLSLSVHDKANQMTQTLNLYQSHLQVLQENTAFAEQLRAWQAGTVEVKNISRTLQSYTNHWGFQVMMVFDPQHRLLLAEGPQYRLPLESQKMIHAAFSSRKIQRGTAQFSHQDESIDYVVPVFANGQPVAVLLARLNTKFLFDSLLRRSSDQQHLGQLSIVHQIDDRVHLFRADHEQTRYAYSPQSYALTELPDLLKAVSQHASGDFMGSDIAGQEIMAAYQLIDETNWKIVASRSEQDVLAEVNDWFLRLTFLAMAVLLLIIVLVWFLSARFYRKQLVLAAQEHRKCDQVLQSFFDLSFVGMALISPQKRQCLRVNQKLLDILGYDESVLLGLDWLSLSHPDELEVTMQQYRQMTAGELDCVTVTKSYLHQNGGFVLCEAAACVLRNTNGDIEYICLMIQEAVEEVKANQADASDFVSLVNAIPLPVLLLKDQHVDFVNQSFKDHLGYAKDDFGDLRAWWLEVCPDALYREKMIALWQEKQQAAQQARSVFEFELNLTSKAGQMRNYVIYVAPLSEGGAWSQMFALVDITQRKQAEKDLRKLFLAVEQSPSTIVITDVDANIEYVNQAFRRSSGYSPEEAIGRNPRMLRSGKNAAATYQEMWGNLTHGEPWQGELINRRKDGFEYTESVLISPLREEDGTVTNYVAVKENITARKKSEAELNDRLEELRRWYDASIGREMRIIELKGEVNELLYQLGQDPRYMDQEREMHLNQGVHRV